MKISHKLILGFLLVASLASVSTFFTLRSYDEINAHFAELMDEPTRMIEALNGLKQAGSRVISSTSEFGFLHSEAARLGEISDGEVREEEQVNAGHQDFDGWLKRYDELARKDTTDDTEILGNLTSSGNNLINTSRAIVELKKHNISGRQVLEKKEVLEADEHAFLKYVDDALAVEAAEQVEVHERVHASIAAATRRTFMVRAFIFVLAILTGFLVAFSISRRIRKLKDATQKVGDGELDTRIDINSKDEIGDLSRSFNTMIANLKESRAEIESQRERVDTMVANVQGVVWETKTKMEKGETSLRFDFVSDYIETMLGYTAAECLAKPDFWLEIVHPDDRKRTEQIVRAIFAGGKGGTLEFRWVAKDGHEVWVESRNVIIRDDTGNPIGMRGIAVDITDRKSLEEQLTHQALHDPLTKLANRVLFRDRVEHALTRTARKRTPVAVLFLDLDNFKSVNDSLGHAAGDELLISVTQRLLACLRSSDTAARLGGDEFAILVEDIQHADEAGFIAERIRSVLCMPFSIGGTELFISTSIGIATTVNEHETPEELLRNADVAMYSSKSKGKDQFTIFESEMHDTLIKRVRLESDMRSAIDKREFEVYYQPILELHSERVVGMEALVRWNHPEHGLIPPLDFIPLAEETGLIVPLGKWILEEACMRARKWQLEFGYGEDLSITVNIGSRQFQDDRILQDVQDALSRSKLPPKSLVLEITEGTMLMNTEATIAKLQELKRLGIRLAIDDFGTGFSSLSYLQRFPVDILKIDKAFVDKIASGKEGAAVAKAIITMSTTLSLETIAEGIESSGQQTELQNLGCELGQGFHFAKPLRKADMDEFLRSSCIEHKRVPSLRALSNIPVNRKDGVAVAEVRR